MKDCWAQAFSPCKGKISREHYISRSIFEQDFVYVSGFNWCKGKEKRVSLSSLTSKVLCEHHNNTLSVIDQVGANAIRVFESILPANCRFVTTPPDNIQIDGLNFERWLLKIALTISFKSELHIGFGMTDSTPGWPSPYLLQVVFGNLPFTHKMGLYTFGYDAVEKIRAGSIALMPIHKEGHIGGFWYHIRGMDFFLSLYPGYHLPRLSELGISSKGDVPAYVVNALPEYRREKIIVLNEKRASSVVLFKWDHQSTASTDLKYYMPPETD